MSLFGHVYFQFDLLTRVILLAGHNDIILHVLFNDRDAILLAGHNDIYIACVI
jgi:hypothetical protein